MFAQNTNSLKPAAGRLLLSEPFLFDPNFKRTVVILCEHNEKGSFGFVLNKPVDIILTDVLDIDTVLDIPLYLGGPVQNDTLHFIHKDKSLADLSIEVGDGIYWGGGFEEVRSRIENNTLEKENFIFFIGYSGWGTGQLEEELDSKSWIVANASARIVFEQDNETMWKNILREMGSSYSYLSNAPENPQMN
jgi:putative transcriptional regulator